jgi:hypothetical protein
MSDLSPKAKVNARLINHQALLDATKDQVSGGGNAVADAISSVLPIFEEQAAILADLIKLLPEE